MTTFRVTPVKSQLAWQVLLAVLVVFLTQASAVQSQAQTQPSSSKVFAEKTDLNFQVGYTVLSDDFPFRDQSVPFKIAVWYPSTKGPAPFSYPIGAHKISTDVTLDGPVSPGKFPVIFYSHGATGAGTSSFFICEMLAKNGYIVVAPDFLDTVYVARIDQAVPFDEYLRMRTAQYISWLKELGLNKASSEGRALFAYRPLQLKQTMEKIFALNRDSKSSLFQHLDEERVGLFGHSFGAWTSVLIAGASPALGDSRVKAVVALSGPVNQFVYAVASENDLNAVHVPILFEYGENETANGRKDDKTYLYEKATAPKMLISVKDADHLSFSGGVQGEHKLASEYLTQDASRKTISETTLEFFDAFIKGDLQSKTRLKSRTEGVASSFAEF